MREGGRGQAPHSGSQGRRKQLRETQGFSRERKGHAGSIGWLNAAYGRLQEPVHGHWEGRVRQMAKFKPLYWSEERGRCLGLFLPLPLLHPSAELGFPEFGCLSGDQAQMSPQSRAGENCQPATMWKPPSLKTEEVRRVGNAQRKLSAFSRESLTCVTHQPGGGGTVRQVHRTLTS